MLIVRLVREDLVYVPGLPPAIGSSDGLLALIGTAFDPIVEICISNKNKCQQ